MIIRRAGGGGNWQLGVAYPFIQTETGNISQ